MVGCFDGFWLVAWSVERGMLTSVFDSDFSSLMPDVTAWHEFDTRDADTNCKLLGHGMNGSRRRTQLFSSWPRPGLGQSDTKDQNGEALDSRLQVGSGGHDMESYQEKELDS